MEQKKPIFGSCLSGSDFRCVVEENLKDPLVKFGRIASLVLQEIQNGCYISWRLSLFSFRWSNTERFMIY